MSHLNYMISLTKLCYLCVLVVFLVCLSSCHSENEVDICVKDITGSTTTLERSSNCTNAFKELSFYTKEKPYVIIESQEEYEDIIFENCGANIDFDKYNLIIGYFRSEKQVISFNNKLYRYCTDNSYGLEVSVERGNPESVTFYTYNLLVPKKEQIDDLVITFVQRG